ncbi:hypothetical protein ACLQ29_29940 [Micromonospora sp. DT228]
MKELTERLRVLRATAKLEDLFDDKPASMEPTNGCAATEVGYSKM